MRELQARLRCTGSVLAQSDLRDADSLVANELTWIHLLIQAWQRMGQLALPLHADVRALLGGTMC